MIDIRPLILYGFSLINNLRGNGMEFLTQPNVEVLLDYILMIWFLSCGGVLAWVYMGWANDVKIKKGE